MRMPSHATLRLIPAIDLRGGRCVRLMQGDFDAETAYEVDALTLLQRYRAAGADWLHIVDLDGARDGAGANRAIITHLAGQAGLALQVGGGIRDRATISAMREAGVARVVVGSAAVAEPDAVRAWLGDFGPEFVALAFDVRLDESGTPRVATHGWRRQSELSLWNAVEVFTAQGLRHVLCTDVRRDGALTGPNLKLYREAVARFPHIEWQASGGVRDARDLGALAAVGAAAAISGKALLEGLIRIEEMQPFLPNA
ncbi:MAG: 1-(5-phosphoribosyl)-5-[(5-phosphoribosylamino)methylideneamino] imidazole-4-carboxamide isomerase [Steroidobacteraceae bacterium]|nr:1-(5-phosphoribosyl)-5-[(5-phosphoribosylamino)methylideneamino] imidazole-4-carboxamide isomerase [Steroidobacteraceae bacterium]